MRKDMKTYEDMIKPLPCGHPMANLNVFGGKTNTARSGVFCCVCMELNVVRLDEAEWWEHLVGAHHQLEGIEECEPDCMYCERIADILKRRAV